MISEEKDITSVQLTACPVHANFDPLTPKFISDPFAVLNLLLKETPIFYAPSIDHYVVTRYADIEEVCLAPESYSSASAQIPLVSLISEAEQILLGGGHTPQPSILSLDPPEHSRLRYPAARAFTPRRVAKMAPLIRSTVNYLLDAVEKNAPFDLISTLTFPLPAVIIFSFLGVPEHDWEQLKEWSIHRTALTWGRPTPKEQVRHATNVAAYRSYIRSLVAYKNSTRGDDFASALLVIHDENPEALTHEEIGSILYSLTFAGLDTVSYLIGNVVRNLLEDPVRWDSIVIDPTLISNAIEETLRYDTSVPTLQRVTKQSVTLGGINLPKGAKLLLWLPTSGRDESLFPNPDAFTLHRLNPSKTLALGKGIHYCLGAALGKLETQLALEALIQRFPNLRLVDGQEFSFLPNISFRGTQSLWVYVTPQGTK